MKRIFLVWAAVLVVLLLSIGPGRLTDAEVSQVGLALWFEGGLIYFSIRGIQLGLRRVTSAGRQP